MESSTIFHDEGVGVHDAGLADQGVIVFGAVAASGQLVLKVWEGSGVAFKEPLFGWDEFFEFHTRE